ncbi:protein translocase subunit SecF [Patescibacteria group bacterium]|nr:MAG: protein translocase subunit SecF [Patescibacteria group bacterium]
MTIPFIKYSKVLLSFSGLVTVAAFVLIFMWGLKPGIDFTGGSLLEISFSRNRPPAADVQKVFAEVDLKNVQVQNVGEDSIIIRTEFLSEEKHQEALKRLTQNFQTKENTVKEISFETIGSAVSKQLRTRAVWAIIFVNLGIILYIAYAFRKVSRPVASWKYGLLAIIAVVHDVFLVMGIFSVLGHGWGVEVDIAFVVALLTVLGFSVHDTIVVYDRIRENLLRRRNEDFAEVVNNGLNQTLMRSINTTVTTLFALIALYLFGGASIHYFALALLIGFASGAYSSIFIAAPLLVLAEKWQRRAVV